MKDRTICRKTDNIWNIKICNTGNGIIFPVLRSRLPMILVEILASSFPRIDLAISLSLFTLCNRNSGYAIRNYRAKDYLALRFR